MGQAPFLIDEHDEPKIIGTKIEPAQRQILGNDIILTVSAFGEELARPRPVIFHAPVVLVRDETGRVNETVDHTDLPLRIRLAQRVEELRPFLESARLVGSVRAISLVATQLCLVATHGRRPLAVSGEASLVDAQAAEKVCALRRPGAGAREREDKRGRGKRENRQY